MRPSPAECNGHIRLICFDLGGVVVRICRSWQEACRLAELPIRDHDLHGDEVHLALRQVIRRHQCGEIDRRTYATIHSELISGIYSPEEIIAIHDAWLIDEYDGVAELIDRIHDAGYDTAALSNTDHEHWKRLVRYPSISKLRHPLASHLLQAAKPDPQIYRRFEQRVKCSGSEIVFFDDLAENVAAATEAGWRAAQIDPELPTTLQITMHLHRFGVKVPCAEL